jgi:hypothetical protein
MISLERRNAGPKLIINRISHFHELANTVLDFIFYDFVKKYIKQV